MRYLTKAILIPLGSLALAVLVGLLLFSSGSTAAPISPASRVTRIDVSSTETYFTRDEMIKQAAAIFIGEVQSISRTRWNQDSGEYWEAAGHPQMPYFEVKIKVSETLVDTLSLGSEVIVTVLGSSPAGNDAVSNVQVGGDTLALRTDDLAIFFIRATEITWRDANGQIGKRPVQMFANVGDYSYLLRQADGRYKTKSPAEQEPVVTLEFIKDKIKQLRPN